MCPAHRGLVAQHGSVKVLATAREQLGVPGEVTWRVRSLSTPSPETVSAVPALSQYDAVRLFIDRARRGPPDIRGRRRERACRSRRSAIASTASRSRSSWRRLVAGRCPLSGSPSSSTIASICSPEGPASCSPVNRRWPRRSNGATTCSTRASGRVPPPRRLRRGVLDEGRRGCRVGVRRRRTRDRVRHGQPAGRQEPRAWRKSDRAGSSTTGCWRHCGRTRSIKSASPVSSMRSGTHT